MMLQTFRRFYETHFVQIFSKTAKINITHYLVGYLHYFGTMIVILGNSPGFTGSHSDNVEPFHAGQLLNLRIIFCSAVFLYAWFYQFLTNLIFCNLRKNKTGECKIKLFKEK